MSGRWPRRQLTSAGRVAGPRTEFGKEKAFPSSQALGLQGCPLRYGRVVPPTQGAQGRSRGEDVAHRVHSNVHGLAHLQTARARLRVVLQRLRKQGAISNRHRVVHVEDAIEGAYSRQRLKMVSNGDETGEVDAIVRNAQVHGRVVPREFGIFAIAVDDEVPGFGEALREGMCVVAVRIAIDDDEGGVGKAVTRAEWRASLGCKPTQDLAVVIVGTCAAPRALISYRAQVAAAQPVLGLAKIFVGITIDARHFHEAHIMKRGWLHTLGPYGDVHADSLLGTHKCCAPTVSKWRE